MEKGLVKKLREPTNALRTIALGSTGFAVLQLAKPSEASALTIESVNWDTTDQFVGTQYGIVGQLNLFVKVDDNPLDGDDILIEFVNSYLTPENVLNARSLDGRITPFSGVYKTGDTLWQAWESSGGGDFWPGHIDTFSLTYLLQNLESLTEPIAEKLQITGQNVITGETISTSYTFPHESSPTTVPEPSSGLLIASALVLAGIYNMGKKVFSKKEKPQIETL